MRKRMIRRRRRVLFISILGVLLMSVILGTVYIRASKKTIYLPGKDLEGLTNDLNRDIPPDYPRVKFTDVTQGAGISFRHFQEQRGIQLPEDMGSGLAWADYDNDGWMDLFLVNFSGRINPEKAVHQDSPAACALYHNNGDGTFTDVSKQAGLDLRCWGMGAAWADYDNDGWTDLFVSAFGTNHLFRNKGDGSFQETSRQAGIDAFPGFWAGASWGDFNKDGYPDLYVCGYVKYEYQSSTEKSMQYDVEVPASLNPSSFSPERNLLFRNNGNGTFTEIAKKSGVDNENGRSLSAVWADFDADGWPDIYVANDVSDNVLYKNLGNGHFKEISHQALVADYRGAMGIAVGDWDGDADLDMFITHWIAQENALYSNLLTQLSQGDRPLRELRFMDEADRFGLGQIALDFIGWGTSFFDYDNDGRPDLFVVNGSTFQRKEDPTQLVPMRNLLFWNKGNAEGFFEVGPVSGAVFQKENVGRGAAFADFDNDGDVDVCILNNNGAPQLLRNDGGNSNRWLEVSLEGARSNRSGLGARLRVVTPSGSQVQLSGSQGSYCSQNSPVLHFGLGKAQEVDTLEVVWPSGKRQRFNRLPSNKLLVLREGEEIRQQNAPPQ